MANFPSSLPSATPATHGEVVDEVVAVAGYLLALPGRNRIINGNFRTNQRGYASAGSLASGSYGFDRWKSTTASSSMTFTAAPQGQTVTINSGGSFAQIIERANVEADTYVLSWTGTATGRVYNVGGSAPGYAASPVTVVVDGTADLTVEFTASGATKTLGLVQLEAGDAATAFERFPVQAELALCQRYLHRVTAGPTIGSASVGTGVVTLSTQANITVPFPVAMRAAPTFTWAGTLNIYDGTAIPAASAISHPAASWQKQAALLSVTGTGLTVGRGAYLIPSDSTALLSFDSEL